MKSPFPGMDPYLERHWGDVHSRLVVYASDQLQTQMPADLKVRIEEHVAIHEDEEERGYYPDVRVVERPGQVGGPRTALAESGIAETLIVPLEVEGETQRSIRIIDTKSGDRVVTAIEILSPSNKNGDDGRQAYRSKQRDLLAAGANLVEIDLLREGRYMMVAPARCVPVAYQGPYRISVFRASQPLQVEMYRVPLEQRLPTVLVPLRPGEADARLDVQSLVDRAYENGGYDDTDYRVAPFPPLEGPLAAWADALLREKGRR